MATINSETLLLFCGNAKRLCALGVSDSGKLGPIWPLRHTTLKGFKGNCNVS